MSARDPLKRARRVVRAAGITALVASALLLVSIPRAVEVCNGALIEVPEPPLWRRAPYKFNDSRGIGEFGYAWKTELGPDGVRTAAARVYDRGFCLSTGLSLDRWVELQRTNSSNAPDLSIQHDPASNVFTISSKPHWLTASRLDHVHVASFRRDVGTRPSVASSEGLAVALLFAAGAALAGFAFWFARRELGRAGREQATGGLDSSITTLETTDRAVRVARTSLFVSLLFLAAAATIRIAAFLEERSIYGWMTR